MRVSRLLLALGCAALALAPVAQAETRFLELDPSRLQEEERDVQIGVCTILHEIYPVYCQYWHVIAVFDAVGPVQQGQTFRAESAKGTETFRIEWAGLNYLLENGQMVAPVGGQQSNDVIGARWVETYPGKGNSRVVTAWTDRNNDGKVGVLDTLELDNGREVRITDQRYGMFVTPALFVTPAQEE